MGLIHMYIDLLVPKRDFVYVQNLFYMYFCANEHAHKKYKYLYNVKMPLYGCVICHG